MCGSREITGMHSKQQRKLVRQVCEGEVNKSTGPQGQVAASGTQLAQGPPPCPAAPAICPLAAPEAQPKSHPSL